MSIIDRPFRGLLYGLLLVAVALPVAARADDPPPPPGDVLLFEDFAGGMPDGWARFGNEYCCGASLWAARTENGTPIMRSRWTNTPPPGQVARDLLAMPAITLGGSSIVRFAAARSFDDPAHTSLYAVWVARVSEATGQTDLDAYTFVQTWSSTEFPLITDDWGVVDVDLSDYDNDEVYIAFVHTQFDGDNFNLNYAYVTTEHAEAAAEPTEIVFHIDPADPVAEQTLLLSNVAPAGAGNLLFEIPTARAIAGNSSFRTATSTAEITLTQSDRTLVEDDLTACVIAGLGTRENHYWRVFDLATYDVSGDVEIAAVEIGIGDVVVPAGFLPTTVRLHTLDGDFVLANLTLLAEANYHVLEAHADDTMVVIIPGGATFDGDDVVVVEWHLNSGLPTGSYVYPGGNDAGQTGPTFHSSPDCAIDEPTDLADLGAPDEHWVVDLHGQGQGVLTVQPRDGAVEPGQGAEVLLTADAAELEDGAHEFELRIRTNVPDQPVVTIGVTVLVGPVDSEGGAAPRAFAVEQNFPNPFAGVTTITYHLPHSALVSVVVYDAAGRRVATLVEGFRQPGLHEVKWNASDLAAGVYLYRIRAGDRTETRRAVITH